MTLKMIIPKGRMNAKVLELLADVGIKIHGSERNYRPAASEPDMEIKLLKSQNIPPLVALGQHDCGFAGADWIVEQSADVERVLDLGFDPVRLVACIPEDWDWDNLRKRPLIAVSEYRNLCTQFLHEHGVEFTFLQSYGATEVFPPEDADLVVDNTSTGTTLIANRLKIVHVIMESSTQFIANKRAMDDPIKRERIENLAMLFKSVLDGRDRVLLEMNCTESDLEAVVDLLPCMKAPTISQLYRQKGFAVKAAVLKDKVKDIIPLLRQNGATDILETPVRKVLP